MKAKSGTVKAAVLTYCEIKDGLTLRELADKIERTVTVANSTIQPLLEHGELHRAGIYPWCRYFTHSADAQAFDKIAPDLVAKHRAEQKEKNLACNREYKRRMAEQGLQNSNKPRAKKAKTLAPKKSGVVLGKRINLSEKLEAQAAITWPAHVQVQRIPHGVDIRFTFTPPPGWVGEITRDWMMDRRLAEQTT